MEGLEPIPPNLGLGGELNLPRENIFFEEEQERSYAPGPELGPGGVLGENQPPQVTPFPQTVTK